MKEKLSRYRINGDINMQKMIYLREDETWNFRTGAESSRVPSVRSRKSVDPVLVMTALILVFPMDVSLTSRPELRF